MTTRLRRGLIGALGAFGMITGTAMLAEPASAQGTALVLPGDPVYRDLDRLAALGMLDSVVMGHRPYSRREIGRIARVAQERYRQRAGTNDTGIDPVAIGVLRSMASRFEEDDAVRPVVAAFDGGSLGYVGSSVERRSLVGEGRDIEATIGAFDQRRLGQPELQGHGTWMEVAQRVEPWPWLALSARERVALRVSRDPGRSAPRGELLVASVRARARNVAVTVGRSPIAWSQESGAGLIFASAAPPLDMISVAGDRPFLLPGILRRAGPMQATLLVADLGASRVRSHSRLLAYKVSLAPGSGVEVGGSFTNRFGGAGARPASVGDRLIDFLPFIDIFRRHNYTDTTRTLEVESDKMLGLDGRMRLPRRLGGIVLSGELVVDDFDVNRLSSLLTWDGSQSLRVTVPRLVREDMALHLAATHTGIRAYGHLQLSAGHATRGRLLGDELGPDAKAFGAQVAWTPRAGTSVTLGGRSAIHSKAEYTYVTDGSFFALRRLTDASNEQRDRITGTLTMQTSRDVTLAVLLGALRTRNHAFSGITRHDGVAELSIVVAR